MLAEDPEAKGDTELVIFFFTLISTPTIYLLLAWFDLFNIVYLPFLAISYALAPELWKLTGDPNVDNLLAWFFANYYDAFAMLWGNYGVLHPDEKL